MRTIVTGAARGLGAEIAARFARDGGAVALLDAAASVTETAGALGSRSLGVVVDVADETQVAAAVDTALEALQGVDLLVNCAGIGGPSDAVLDTELSAFKRTLEVNLVGTFLMARSVAREMVRQGTGGAIVNVGSLFGQQGVPYGAAYCASKGGVTLLTHSLALELAPHGITVNTIAPGNMATEMHLDDLRSRSRLTGTSLEQEMESARAAVPLGRHGTGQDVAGVVAWLASPDASYVTGQTVAVNGGLLLT